MENEPSPLGPFRLEFDTGNEIICRQDNTSAFIHTLEPYGDHLFIHQEAIDDQPERGDYVFREQIKNFQEIVDRMKSSGWMVIVADKVREDDLEAYEEFKAMKERNLKLKSAGRQDSAYDLTPRQNNLSNFVAYLLLHEHLSAEDFNGDGDLFI